MKTLEWFFLALALLLAGCSQRLEYERDYDPYGGQDAVWIDLPFGPGYQSQCVQGVAGAYSHMYESTLYDIDLDTPNWQDDIVFAPASGTAYVHNDGSVSGFGLHINLDLGDGTYIILGHLAYAFVESGEEVAAGQILAFEGTTGYSTGDHLHMGRHLGDATQSGGSGTSVMGMGLHVRDTESVVDEWMLTSDMWCDLSWGHIYESQLQVARWHPNGALLTTPNEWQIYRKEGGVLRPFYSEDSMWQAGQNYGHVILTSDYELGCYGTGKRIQYEKVLAAVDDGARVWLLREDEDATKTRYLVPARAWKPVLASWGVKVDSMGELPMLSTLPGYARQDDEAVFRDGTLLKETGKSDVYFVSGGVAMPIEDWDTFLLMGLWDREILEVDAGIVNSVQGRIGYCQTGLRCITTDVVQTCGYEPEDSIDDEDDSEDGNQDDEEVEDDTGSNDDEGPEPSELQIWWIAPGAAKQDSIELSGEYVQASGSSSGWQTWTSARSDSQVQVTFPATSAGDSFRFSVEYRSGSAVSWSCIAPFPPGTLNGRARASLGGAELTVFSQSAPGSDGCELYVEVP